MRPDGTVGQIGGSDDRRKFGSKTLGACRVLRFADYPIKPPDATVERLETYSKIHGVGVAGASTSSAPNPQVCDSGAERPRGEARFHSRSESKRVLEAGAL